MPGVALALAVSPAVQAGGAGGGGDSAYVIDFDGSATELNCGSDASVDGLLGGALTVEAWVYADTPGGFGHGCIASKGDYQGDWWLGFANYTAAPFAFEAKTGDTYTLISAECALSLGEWHHVAGTYDYDGDKKFRVWVDGVLAATSAAATGVWTDASANDMMIGRASTATNRYWDGRIGWLRVSDVVRYSSTFTPVARCSPPATDGNTRLLLKMTEGSGNPQDSSGNGNHGVLSSGTWQAC